MLAHRLAGLLALTLAACADPPPTGPHPSSPPNTPNTLSPQAAPTGTDSTGATPPAVAAHPAAPLATTPSPRVDPAEPDTAAQPVEPPAEPSPLTPTKSPGLQALTGGRWHLVLADTHHRRADHLTIFLDLAPFATLPLPRQRPHCAHPRLLGGHASALTLTVELVCQAPPSSARRASPPRRRPAPTGPPDAPQTLTFDLASLPPTRLVAGAPLPDTAPVATLGFPALSPDAIHVALVEHLTDGSLRLGVRRVDDGREVFDEPLLSAADVRFRPHETSADRQRRLARAAGSRVARIQRMLDRVGFTPMVRAALDGLAAPTPLTLSACTPRRTRAMNRAGGIPSFAGCVPEGCDGLAPVLQRWRGGEPLAGLGVEALRVDGGPAGCGPGERWLIRPSP